MHVASSPAEGLRSLLRVPVHDLVRLSGGASRETWRFRAGDRWVEIPLAGVFKIRHGQITLWRDYFDRDMLLQAIAPPA